MTNSTEWTRLVRYTGKDGQVRLGQPVDPTVDVGLAVAAGQEVQVYVIDGDVYTGTVTSTKDVVKKVRHLATVHRLTLNRFFHPSLATIAALSAALVSTTRVGHLQSGGNVAYHCAAHAKEANMAIPNEPILFIKPRTALAGPGELPVAKVSQDDQLDFETELALVIGKDALNISEEDALDYVLG